MTAPATSRPARSRGRLRSAGGLYGGHARAVLYRGYTAAKGANLAIMLSGFVEPVFYLLSMGVGLGPLVGAVADPGGQAISYAAYIAPGLLAVAAMNGAIYDSTFNVFFKMHFSKVYLGMLNTPVGPADIAIGEISIALIRGASYGVAFMAVMQVMGLFLSPWGLLALPSVVLIAFAFAACGMAVTSCMKTFQQMDWISFATLPMFLFSATFYPLDVYPQAIQWLIQCMPLWHGVELVRGLTTGAVGWGLLGHVAYLAIMAAIGLFVATRRMRALFMV